MLTPADLDAEIIDQYHAIISLFEPYLGQDDEDDEEFLEDCPVCGTENSINGSGRCSYCGYWSYR